LRGAGAVRPGTRFVHVKTAATELFSIQTSHRLDRFFIIRRFHESKTACSASLPICRYVNPCNLPEPLEERGQITFRGLEAHITNKEAFHFSP
jgi:hypothetical protein